MDFHCPAGDSGDPCIYCHWRRNSVAPLELAVAAPVRLAPDHPLANPLTSRAVPHPLRRMGGSLLSSLQYTAANTPARLATHGRRLGGNDTRGQRETLPGPF